MMMTAIEQTVGQLFVVGFHDTKVNDEIRTMIRDYHVGGVILFARNVENAGQLAQLTNDLQAEAKAAGYATPLLICMDQENGVIRRLAEGAAALPGAMTIAATGSPDNAEAMYGLCGSELAQVGVNWDLAPDADVNNNPDNPVIGTRSFGDDPKAVAQYVQAAVQGLQGQNVAACLKHFPGHGNTAVDSHLGLPVIERSLADLEKVELIPFGQGIKAQAASVMAAHIVFPALDEKFPASLSAAFLHDMLRDQLGYQGLVVTDDLEMLAIADHYGTAAACVTAIKNGADMVMVSHTQATQIAAIEAVVEGLHRGLITASQIEAAATRVQAQQRQFGRWDNGFESQAFAAMVADHQQQANQVYQASVTGVIEHLNLKPERHVVVVTLTNQTLANVVDLRGPESVLVNAVKQQTANMTPVFIDTTATDPVQQLPPMTADDAVIIATTNVKSTQDVQALVVQACLDQTQAVAVIAMRNPYDQQYLPANLAAYLVTYENTPYAVDLAVASLYGQSHLSGHLPVRLP